MDHLDYWEARSTDPLSPIECVWEFRGAGGAPQRIATDARAEIIVQLAAPMEQRDGATWRLQPREIFSGQITRPLMIRPTGEVHTVGIRLKTWATALACEADATTVTNQLLELGGLGGRFAEECRKIAEQKPGERLQAAATLFTGRRLRSNLPQERTRWAVLQAEARCGDVRVTALARAAHMSLRSFERHLSAAVGVGPKMLLRMLRFRAAVKMLEQPAPAAEVAARLGYADQSHLCKDFLRFAGAPPSDFKSAETAMASNFFRGG